jgi:hypothetical protein
MALTGYKAVLERCDVGFGSLACRWCWVWRCKSQARTELRDARYRDGAKTSVVDVPPRRILQAEASCSSNNYSTYNIIP